MNEANSPLSEASKPDAVTELLKQLKQGGKLVGLLESAARQNSTQKPPPGSLSGDILYGAEEIAIFLYGDKKFRRRVYNLVEAGCLPHFRLGASICSRKSVLLGWIAQQETGCAPRADYPAT